MDNERVFRFEFIYFFPSKQKKWKQNIKIMPRIWYGMVENGKQSLYLTRSWMDTKQERIWKYSLHFHYQPTHLNADTSTIHLNRKQ